MRYLVVGSLALALSVPFVHAGRIERELEARWRGAYVVLNVESRSNCDGRYTNNRINGLLSQGSGRREFGPGELGQVKKLDVKRSRVDVLVDVREQVLAPRIAGPFTLYDELHCRVELEIEVPRELVRTDDVDGLDGFLRQAMDGFVTLEEAQASERWNGREREDYPPDYEETLFAYETWKVEQHNLQVEELLRASDEVLSAVTNSISGEPHYVRGFAAGVETARPLTRSGRCDTLATVRLVPPVEDVPEDLEPDEANGRQWQRGFAEGFLLVRALHLRDRLPQCFLPEPHRAASAGAGVTPP